MRARSIDPPVARRVTVRSQLLALAWCAFSGCYSPLPADGQILCAGDGACPAGYTCAPDHACWRNGHLPPSDLRMNDLASVDLASSPADAAGTD